MTPAETFAQAHARLNSFLGELVAEPLFVELSTAANELYKEQFAAKQNPYGEAWDYRAGDEKRTTSYYKFGAISDVSREGFAMAVASARANRSCVPFEPRGLGAWRQKFDEILQARVRVLFRSVRP